MANKILIPLQSLVPSFLQHPINRQAAVGAPGCLEGSSISCALVYGVSSVLNLCAKDQVNENCEQQVRYLADFLVGYEGDSLVGTFFPLLSPPVLQLLSPSMPLFDWPGHHLSISESCV